MKAALAIAALTWAVLIAYLLLTPDVPTIGLDVSDTTAHMIAFMGLALPIWGLVLGGVTIRRVAAAIVGMLLFGIAVELAQSWFTEVRQAQISDVVADLAGILLGAVAVGAVHLVAGRSLPRSTTLLAAGSWLSIVLLALFAFARSEAGNIDLCPDFEVESRSDSGGPEGRATDGLVGLYDFVGDGADDLSGVTPNLPLEMVGADPTDLGLVFDGGNDAAITDSALKLNCTMAMAEEFTIDVWFTSADITQNGPTRIVGLSSGTLPTDTNVRIGQEFAGLDVRLAVDGDITSHTVEEQIVAGRPTHVALRFDSGTLDLFVDSIAVWSEDVGDLRIWDVTRPLVIGNEATRDRGFVGTIALVALYDRALDNEEVAQNALTRP